MRRTWLFQRVVARRLSSMSTARAALCLVTASRAWRTFGAALFPLLFRTVPEDCPGSLSVRVLGSHNHERVVAHRGGTRAEVISSGTARLAPLRLDVFLGAPPRLGALLGDHDVRGTAAGSWSAKSFVKSLRYVIRGLVLDAVGLAVKAWSADGHC